MSNNKPLPNKPFNSKRFLADQFLALSVESYSNSVLAYQGEGETLPDAIRDQLLNDHGANIDELKDFTNDYGGNINDAIVVLSFLGY
jgi:hypothetical protein